MPLFYFCNAYPRANPTLTPKPLRRFKIIKPEEPEFCLSLELPLYSPKYRSIVKTNSISLSSTMKFSFQKRENRCSAT
jgi:hypothetical protein